jgi:hypothetical protein
MLLKQCALLIAWTLVVYLFIEFLENDGEDEASAGVSNNSDSFIYGHERTARVVDLSNRDMETIDCPSLEKFTNLQLLCRRFIYLFLDTKLKYLFFLNIWLDMSSNKISDIEDNCFLFLKKLKYLDLSHNCLSAISKNAFAGLASIEHLVLTHNNISQIHERAFHRMDHVHVQQLQSLGHGHIRVYLANNPIYDVGLDENGVLTKLR